MIVAARCRLSTLVVSTTPELEVVRIQRPLACDKPAVRPPENVGDDAVGQHSGGFPDTSREVGIQ